jgi:hypothetical protein
MRGLLLFIGMCAIVKYNDNEAQSNYSRKTKQRHKSKAKRPAKKSAAAK